MLLVSKLKVVQKTWIQLRTDQFYENYVHTTEWPGLFTP